jgi:hypothetical protein
VSSVPGDVSLFVADRRGTVQGSYFDPRVADLHWVDLFNLSEAGKGYRRDGCRRGQLRPRRRECVRRQSCQSNRERVRRSADG